MNKPYTEMTSLVVVADDLPDQLFAEEVSEAFGGQYFVQIFLRWRDLFALVPSAKDIDWHGKIDFPDSDMFHRTMRLVVESDVTPQDLFEDIVSTTDGLVLRWREFLKMVPEAKKVDWLALAKRTTDAVVGGMV